MVEEQRRRVEGEITRVVEEIDKSFLRKMQADMHRCAATCYDNESYSVHRVANCVENCGSALNNAQQYITEEIERVQNRLQRCVMDCNDRVRDKMGPSPSQNDVDKFSNDFENFQEIQVMIMG
ncbi:protein FAM136A isoform X2 [Belonocnema kinseyi]|uniref:protein FAM136A isoform X2 n=1 Tax=Belonocnema kinseyi TaxID=2817044 RepID=UPI00143DF09C|nr:protein FAM136A isoform X2 [Belonocnema kinseyi]